MTDVAYPAKACLSTLAGGRQDRCGLFGVPPRCGHISGVMHCSMRDAVPAPTTTTPRCGDDCAFCEGSGVVEENHGQGNVEQLGCGDCAGTGQVHMDTCNAWKSGACDCPAKYVKAGFEWWGSECTDCGNATPASMVCELCADDRHTVPLLMPPNRDRLDVELRKAGFRGFAECAERNCPTPFMCSERGSCPAAPEVVCVAAP